MCSRHVLFALLLCSTVFAGGDSGKVTVVQGRTALLQCRCANVRKPLILWRKGNMFLNNQDTGAFADPRMSLATVFDMRINASRRSDSGQFRCIVYDQSDSNPRPPRCDQSVSLTVAALPNRMLAAVGNVTVKQEEEHFVQCKAVGGYPAPKHIKWFYENEDGYVALESANQTQHSDGSLESWLSITAPAQEQLQGIYQRNYKCTVEQSDLTEELERDVSSNGFSLQQNISVEFHYSSKIVGTVTPIVAGSPLEFVENETILFGCNASDAFPTDYTWFWSINGITIESSREIGERYATHQLMLAREHHNQTLSCTVCVSSGCDSKNYTLRVKYPPRVWIEPDRAVTDVGINPVLFVCKAEGNPAPTVTWYNQRGDIVRKSGDLNLKSIRKSDFGVYTCLASSESGKGKWSESAEAHLIEKVAPKIVSQSADQQALIKSSVRLTCDVESAIETTAFWLKDGSRVATNKEASRFATAKDTLNHRTVYTLIITNVMKEDFGEYNCTIRNEKGETSASIWLKETAETPFLAIIIAALALFFTLLILTIAVVACKRSTIKKQNAYRSSKGNFVNGNVGRLAKQKRPNSVVIVHKENGQAVSSAVRDEMDNGRKFVGDEYFPPFIEMDRSAYIRYEATSDGDGNNNSSVHDYNALVLSDARDGTWTPATPNVAATCNGCSLMCTGTTMACRTAVQNGSEMLAIMPRQFHHHPSPIRFNTEVEDVASKEDGGSSHDSGFANSQTLPNSGGLPIMATGLIAPAQRVANIDSVVLALPHGQMGLPVLNDNYMKKPSSTFSPNLPIATSV